MRTSFITDFIDDATGSVLRFLGWCVGVPIVLWFVCHLAAMVVAPLKARLDCAQGRYYVSDQGRVADYHATQALLKERYNVRYTASCFCSCPSTPDETFAYYYSATSRSAIQQHFGKDIFAEIHNEVSAMTPEQRERIYWKSRGIKLDDLQPPDAPAYQAAASGIAASPDRPRPVPPGAQRLLRPQHNL